MGLQMPVKVTESALDSHRRLLASSVLFPLLSCHREACPGSVVPEGQLALASAGGTSQQPRVLAFGSSCTHGEAV